MHHAYKSEIGYCRVGYFRPHMVRIFKPNIMGSIAWRLGRETTVVLPQHHAPYEVASVRLVPLCDSKPKLNPSVSIEVFGNPSDKPGNKTTSKLQLAVCVFEVWKVLTGLDCRTQKELPEYNTGVYSFVALQTNSKSQSFPITRTKHCTYCALRAFFISSPLRFIESSVCSLRSTFYSDRWQSWQTRILAASQRHGRRSRR